MIGDYVWNDFNLDGSQSGESAQGVPNVVVRLVRQSDGAVVQTTVSDAQGLYLFSEYDGVVLPSTTYRVEVVSSGQAALNDRQPTTQNAVGDTLDSDVSVVPRAQPYATAPFSSGPRGSRLLDNADIGLVPTLVVQGSVFEDRDANGQNAADPTDPGVPGVLIELRANDGTLIATTTSGPTGLYTFSSADFPTTIVPGAPLRVDIPLAQAPLANMHETTPNTGPEPTDSDVTRVGTVLRAPVTVPARGSPPTVIDAGVVARVIIADFVFEDIDEDGVQDGGEPGIANIVVQLRSTGGSTLATVATDSNGLYMFDSTDGVLQADTDYVIFIASSQFSCKKK